MRAGFPTIIFLCLALAACQVPDFGVDLGLGLPSEEVPRVQDSGPKKEEKPITAADLETEILLSEIYDDWSKVAGRRDEFERSIAETRAGLPPIALDPSRLPGVEVIMDEFRFVPDALRFAWGQPSRIAIVNKGRVSHYFGSAGFFEAVETLLLFDPESERLLGFSDHIEVPPGSRRLLIIVPKTKGRFELICHIPFHIAEGMKGEIEVE